MGNKQCTWNTHTTMQVQSVKLLMLISSNLPPWLFWVPLLFASTCLLLLPAGRLASCTNASLPWLYRGNIASAFSLPHKFEFLTTYSRPMKFSWMLWTSEPQRLPHNNKWLGRHIVYKWQKHNWCAYIVFGIDFTGDIWLSKKAVAINHDLIITPCMGRHLLEQKDILIGGTCMSCGTTFCHIRQWFIF